MSRAVGIIIRDNKILLLHRIKNNNEYCVLPGGGIEDGETPSQAVIREIEEECSTKNKIVKLLFQIKNKGNEEYYFLIEIENEVVKLGGPEALRNNNKNFYEFHWLSLNNFKNLKNFYPNEAKEKIIKYFKV